ncbi:MAG: glycerol-3-phosphate 1-O-acyltransferase PlsY [Candidatus Zophobacter franzmannii]|nr:glycerol-3-phosphate 1-O-acyltransferase PlsY [Candidatus Zophobacter franzmannii]
MYLLSISIAYFLGSIPFSYLAGKLRGIDIREHGSGNAGATNTLRVLGTGLGVVVMLLDMLKGALAVIVAKLLVPESSGMMYELTIVSIGVIAIVGHIFPVFLKFKGGKGVATTAGVFLSLAPLSIIIAILVFFIIVLLTRYVSLGSILAGLTAFGIVLYQNIKSDFGSLPTLILLGLMVLFIIIRHKSNIDRLLKGTENRISFSKKGRVSK